MLRSVDLPDSPVACVECGAIWHAPDTPTALWWAICRCPGA